MAITQSNRFRMFSIDTLLFESTRKWEQNELIWTKVEECGGRTPADLRIHSVLKNHVTSSYEITLWSKEFSPLDSGEMYRRYVGLPFEVKPRVYKSDVKVLCKSLYSMQGTRRCR